MNLNKLTIHELAKKIGAGEVSPGDVIEDTISGIKATEDSLHAFISFDENELRKYQAKEGMLKGIPIAIKDNFCIEGRELSCGSRILEGFVPTYSATVIKKLLDNGAALIPRANMDEFAMGSSTETSVYGLTRNPCDNTRVPGGSSGGAAAAVGGHEAIAALGSDTGGSIRQPASFCGVVGMKPTYGRVSRYGVVAFASSLDQVGPITKDVTDCAILLGIIAGHDPLDSTSVDIPVPDYRADLGKNIKGLKIGLPKEYFPEGAEGLEDDVRCSIAKAIESLKGQGAEFTEISLPHTEYSIAAYYIIATAEASSNLARFDGVQYGFRDGASGMHEMYSKTRGRGFGPEVKRRIILGTYVLSAGYYDAYYLKALKTRALTIKDFNDAFAKVDVILTPTSPTAAFKFGERTENPLQMYLSDIFTLSVNLAGLPAITVPCGNTGEGLPVGLQIIGRPFDEQRILNTAYAYEQTRV